MYNVYVIDKSMFLLIAPKLWLALHINDEIRQEEFHKKNGRRARIFHYSRLLRHRLKTTT